MVTQPEAGEFKAFSAICTHQKCTVVTKRRTGMTTPLASRRVVFQGLSAVGVAAVLAGCGGMRSQPVGRVTQRSEQPATESDEREPDTVGDRLAGTSSAHEEGVRAAACPRWPPPTRSRSAAASS